MRMCNCNIAFLMCISWCVICCFNFLITLMLNFMRCCIIMSEPARIEMGPFCWNLGMVIMFPWNLNLNQWMINYLDCLHNCLLWGSLLHIWWVCMRWMEPFSGQEVLFSLLFLSSIHVLNVGWVFCIILNYIIFPNIASILHLIFRLFALWMLRNLSYLLFLNLCIHGL